MRRRRLLAGLVLAITVFLFPGTVRAQQIGAPVPDLESLRPPQRLWNELRVLQAHYLLPWSEARVDDCPLIVSAARPDNQTYQNILYANYLWDEYELLSGNRCIVLRIPDVGPLSADDARILLSASAGLGFEEQGFFEEERTYRQYLRNLMSATSCGAMSTSPETEPPAGDTKRAGRATARTTSSQAKSGQLEQQSASPRNVTHDYRPSADTGLFRTDCTNSAPAPFPLAPLECSIGVIGTDTRTSIVMNPFNPPAFPASRMVRILGSNARGDAGDADRVDCLEHGSGFYINSWSIATAAHNYRRGHCTNHRLEAFLFEFPGAGAIKAIGIPNFPASWNVNNPLAADYAVLKVRQGIESALFPSISTANFFSNLPTTVTATGFPLCVDDNPGVHGTMYKGSGRLLEDISMQNQILVHEADASFGTSGGPITSSILGDRFLGIVGSAVTADGDPANAGVAIQSNAAQSIIDWALVRPPDANFDIQIPRFGDFYDFTQPDTLAWAVELEGFTRSFGQGGLSNGNSGQDTIWESDIAGVFATGMSVPPEVWSQTLRAGEHLITVRDANGETAPDVTAITITGPAANFTSPTTDPATCSLGFKHQGAQASCDITIAWTTDMAPDAVVWNATDSAVFATGTGGSQVWPATERPTTFQIYESSAREFLLDEVTVSGFIDARPVVTLAAARCADGLCAAILGQNFAPDVCVQAREQQDEAFPILATFCGGQVNRTFHPESDLFSVRVSMDSSALRSLYTNGGLYLYVINTADNLFDGGHFLKRPSGDALVVSPCTVTGPGQTCGVGVAGEVHDSPFGCLWRAADQSLVTCVGGGDFDLTVPVSTGGEVIELRALEVPAEDTTNWPENRAEVYADSPLLDTLVVAADGPDPYENDDDASQWKPYEGTPQLRNFFDDNIDWIGVFRGGPTTFETTDLTNRVNTCIRIYRANAANNGTVGPILGEDCRIDLDVTATVTLDLPAAPAGYLIQVLNLGALTGPNTRYQLEIRSASSTQIDPRLGTWFNPARTGNGIDLFETTDGRMGFFWYTFEADGTPIWYHSGLATVAGGAWEAELKKSTWDGHEASSVGVGNVRLDFQDPTTASFSWTLDGQSGSEPFQHLFGSGGRSGVWHAPSESGWGIETLEDNGLLGAVVTFYVGSQPRWVGGVQSAGGDVTIPLRWRTGTGLCPSCGGGSATPPPSVDAGTLRLQIPHGASTSGTATTTITTPSGATWNRGPVTIELLTAP